MRKLFLVLFVGLLILTGCGSSSGTETESTPAETEKLESSTTTTEEGSTVISEVISYELKGVTYDVPGEWTEKDLGGDSKYYYPSNGMLMVSVSEGDFDNILDSGKEFLEGVRGNTDYMDVTQEGTISINSQDAYRVVANMGTNERELETEIVVFNTERGLAAFFMGTYKDTNSSEGYKEEFDKILKSISFSPYVPTAESTQAPDASVVESQADLDVTIGEKNALSQAKNYLSIMPFSYSGLVKQLEYEGYSTDEAAYAADNCGADWNEQAAKNAQNYLDTMSFSRQGLIDQLVYEGYTSEQAEYGATAVGY